MTALRSLVLAAALALLAMPAGAQDRPPEAIQIGLSTDRFAITSDFTGADLTIFGSLDNADPQVAREGRYDVIVVLEGPSRPVVVRRKDRIFGMWINTASETFANVPASYSVSLTRPKQDIAEPRTYQQLSLGVDNIYMQPLDPTVGNATLEEFTAALRDRKRAAKLYVERVGGVQFLSQSLFRATVTLAPDVPVGTHKARAFLFRSGAFIGQTQATLVIVKGGFERSVFRAASNHGLLYGLGCVFLAFATGWIGRLVFRKD